MREQDAEQIAVEVCRQCECSGRRDITVNMVERVLQQLRSHRSGCQCGFCTAAAQVSADHVFGVVSSWPRRRPRRARRMR